MVLVSHITSQPAWTAVEVAVAVFGVIVLFVVVKIGGAILKLLFGLFGIAFVLWFFVR